MYASNRNPSSIISSNSSRKRQRALQSPFVVKGVDIRVQQGEGERNVLLKLRAQRNGWDTVGGTQGDIASTSHKPRRRRRVALDFVDENVVEEQVAQEEEMEEQEQRVATPTLEQHHGQERRVGGGEREQVLALAKRLESFTRLELVRCIWRLFATKNKG